MAKEMSMSNHRGGHLYMQTNETGNAVIRYQWSASGALTEIERVPTGGAGSGTFKPISGQESAPNAFEGAGSVHLTADRRFTDEPLPELPDETLFKILDRARFAPSGGNRQGWKVIVVRDRKTREALARAAEPAAKRYAAQVQGGETPWNTSAPGGTLRLSSAPRPPARLPSPCSAHRND